MISNKQPNGTSQTPRKENSDDGVNNTWIKKEKKDKKRNTIKQHQVQGPLKVQSINKTVGIIS
jgi:hypothetical protein